MKRTHPLRFLIRDLKQDLSRVCHEHSQRVDELQNSYFSVAFDRKALQILALELSDHVDFIVKTGIREGVERTIEDLQNKTGQTLDVGERLMLEVKIEEQLQKRFKGKTLNQRLKTANLVVTRLLLQEYDLINSGLRHPSNLKDVINSKGTTNSALGWNTRLLQSEILRSYHYATLEFARKTNASVIEFQFDKAQLDRRKEYRELADGGPYRVQDLPDYPRPNASYLLELKY